MLAPTGDQFEIEGGGYRAVVTESGGALRLLQGGGRPLVDGFAEDALPTGGRGQLLMPWCNRIRDGAYSFGGRDLQLPLTEPRRHNQGAHPYLAVGDGPVDGWELTLPARTRLLVDDRKLPVGAEPVVGSAYDFDPGRPIRGTVLDDAFTDLRPDADGITTVEVRDTASGRGTALWAGAAYRWLQVYSADDTGPTSRRSLAVEPMTAPADAFRSGEGLVTLAPSGEAGDEFSASWGVRVLD
jgi:galactose mutarotase-like enzyme